MKKIIIAIIVLLASVGLVVGINSDSEVYALQVGDVEYIPTQSAYDYQHLNLSKFSMFVDYYGIPDSRESSIDLSNLQLTYWGNNTFLFSAIIISNTIGFPDDGGINNLVQLITDDGTLGDFVYISSSTSGTRARLYYNGGLDFIDITSELINDTFIGYIVNVQLIVNSGTVDINTVIYSFQIIQFINNSLNVVSFPNYYMSYNVQGFGAQLAIPGDSQSTLASINSYSTFNLLLAESNTNMLENDVPMTNKTVWNNLAKNHINYLSSTVGLPIVGYDASKVNANYYQEGFNNGKETGYELGYSEGLEKGQNAGTSWIATISQGVGHVLSLEIAPHLPLGLLVAIPLVMGMIGLILRFWRKD